MKPFKNKISLRTGMALCCVLLIGVACFISVLIFYDMHHAKIATVDELEPDTSSVVKYSLDDYGIDEHEATIIRPGSAIHSKIKYTGNGSKYLQFKGWAFIPGQNIEMVNSHFILRESDTDQYIQLKTICQRREDVTKAYGEDLYNYDLCGLKAVVSIKALERGKTYDIMIAYQNDGANWLVDLNEQITIGQEE